MSLKTLWKLKNYILPSSTVLMLHHISEGEPQNSITLTKRHFELLLNSFSCFCSVQEALEEPKKKRIALSFDDGYSDLLTVAYPILHARNIPFTAFISPGFLGKDGYLTSDQLLTLAADPLVSIGSHSMTHLPLAGKSAEVQRTELLRSKEQLESLLGTEVALFAYPNGQADETTFRILSEAKFYQNAFLASGGGFRNTKKTPFALPRLRADEKTYHEMSRLLKIVYRR
ncbi:MAG: polysaccharide deacetylase family protein [Alphaproteobacteria bacterium]|nr:polysaccharide deacetylase family protein [Alphaproteobacteria bacterium]